MKKINLIVSTLLCINIGILTCSATETVKIEVPANQLNQVNVPYNKVEPSAMDKVSTTTKDVTDKTVEVTKESVENVKNATNQTVEVTKNAFGKAFDKTKKFFNSLNPNKPVDNVTLQKQIQIKTLKNERNQVKEKYNIRINSLNSQMESVDSSSSMSDSAKQTLMYDLNREKKALELQRDSEVYAYEQKIKKIKSGM